MTKNNRNNEEEEEENKNQEKKEKRNYSCMFLKLPPTAFAGYTGKYNISSCIRRAGLVGRSRIFRRSAGQRCPGGRAGTAPETEGSEIEFGLSLTPETRRWATPETRRSSGLHLGTKGVANSLCNNSGSEPSKRQITFRRLKKITKHASKRSKRPRSHQRAARVRVGGFFKVAVGSWLVDSFLMFCLGPLPCCSSFRRRFF